MVNLYQIYHSKTEATGLLLERQMTQRNLPTHVLAYPWLLELQQVASLILKRLARRLQTSCMITANVDENYRNLHGLIRLIIYSFDLQLRASAVSRAIRSTEK